jgi:hypothetical protein
MPGRDGMGPQGMGAMTGRGLGVCRGANPTVYGQGRGRGFRAGNRFNNQNSGSFSNTTELGLEMEEMPEDILKAQKKELLKRVELINQQLNSSSEETK